MKALKIIAMLAVIFTITGFGVNQWQKLIQGWKIQYAKEHYTAPPVDFAKQQAAKIAEAKESWNRLHPNGPYYQE
jgi:cytochrome oxidase assembly protein ShyY1